MTRCTGYANQWMVTSMPRYNVYPTNYKNKFGDALKMFCQEFGVPEKITFDGLKEQACKGTIFFEGGPQASN